MEYDFFLNFSLIPSHFPLMSPPPLCNMRQNRYMGVSVAVARRSRTSQVCEQYKKIYLQQKCRSRKSHVCEHWLRRNLCPGNLSPYYLTKPSHNHTDVTLFRGI